MGWFHLKDKSMHSIILDHILQLLTTIASDLDDMLLDLGSDDKVEVIPGVKVNDLAWKTHNTRVENKSHDSIVSTSVGNVKRTTTGVNCEMTEIWKSKRIKETSSFPGTRMKDTFSRETTAYRSSLVIGDPQQSAFSLSLENASRSHWLISDLSSDGATVSDRNSLRSSEGDFFSAEDRSNGTGTYFASSEGDDGPPSNGGPFHSPTSSTMGVPKTSSYETPYESPPSTLSSPFSSLEGLRYSKAISLLDRLARTHPIWYLPTVARGAAVHLLQATPEGTFLVRQSSRPDTMALSVRSGNRPKIVHYLIQATPQGLSLENSDHFFQAIHTLVAHYCSPQRELPVQLLLPEAILTAKSYQQLAALSYLGQDFWTLSSKPSTTVNGYCKAQIAPVAPYHTGHSHFGFPFKMTTTVRPPLMVNGMAEQDKSRQESSINVMLTSPPSSKAQTTPSHSVNGSTIPKQSDAQTQAQKNLINALNHGTDTNGHQGHTAGDDFVFRPIQTALKELAELGERQRKHHITTGKKQRNSCYTPGYRPESLVEKQPDIQTRARSEEKTKQAQLSASPKQKDSNSDMFTFEVPVSSNSSLNQPGSPTKGSGRVRKMSSPAYVEPYDSLVGDGVQPMKFTTTSPGCSLKSDKKHQSGSRTDSLKRRTYQSTVHAYMTSPRKSGQDQDLVGDITQAEKDLLGGPLSRSSSTRGSSKSTPAQHRKFLEAELQRSIESLNSELSKLDLSKCDTSFETNRSSKRYSDISLKDSDPRSSRASGTFETISDSAVATPRDSQISSQSFSSSRESDVPFSGLASTNKTHSLPREKPNLKIAITRDHSQTVHSSPHRAKTTVPNLPKSPRVHHPVGKTPKSPKSPAASRHPGVPPMSPKSSRSKSRGHSRTSHRHEATKGSGVHLTTPGSLSLTHGSHKTRPPVVSPSFDENFFSQQLQEILDVGPPVGKFPVSSPTKSQGSAKSNRTSYSESSTVEDLISDVSPDLTLKPIKPLTISNVQRMSQYDNISGLLELANVKPPASSAGTNYCKPWDSSNLWEDLMRLGSTARPNNHEPSPSLNGTQRSDSDDSSFYVESVSDSHLLDPKIEMMSELATSFEWKKVDCDSALDTLTIPIHDECGCRADVNLELRRMTYVSDDEGVEDDHEEDSIHPEQMLLSSSKLISSRTKGAHQAGLIVKDYVFTIAQDVSTTFGLAIHHFIQCTIEGCEKDPHVVMRNVRQFMNGIKNYLVQHGEGELNEVIERERAKLEGDEFLNIDAVIEGALHKCVIKPLKQHIYKLFVDHYKSNGKLSELSDGITYGRMKTPEELGVKEGLLVPQGNALEVIKNCLIRMQRSYSPIKKLQNFLAATSAIYNYVQGTWTRHKCKMQGSIQADDFLPLLMHVLVQSGLVSAEIEADYMWGLLHPSILAGEGGYYLTTLSSAVHILKSLRISDEANLALASVNGEESLGKKSTISILGDCQGFIKVVLPDEQHGSISAKTFPIRPHTTTREFCTIMAHKFKITNPQDYGLYVVVNGIEERLAEQAFPQHVQTAISIEGNHSTFAYKRNNAKFVWPVCFKS